MSQVAPSVGLGVETCHFEIYKKNSQVFLKKLQSVKCYSYSNYGIYNLKNSVFNEAGTFYFG